MTTHMLVQIPALCLVGWWIGDLVLQQFDIAGKLASRHRWAMLVLALSTFALWMIPRLLDLAVESGTADVAKISSVVFAGGLPLRLAWKHLGPVSRGVIHVEALATMLRLGWIYLDSPSRLCLAYGLSDQQRLGELLLFVAGVYGLYLAWVALARSPGSTSCSGKF